MTPEIISAIHDFTLQVRELLEKEVGEQLEGIYGLLPSGQLETSEKYPALTKLHEAGETRKRLEQFLEDEKAAGVNLKEARDKLAKETAFTWLNRLVAFKMMESRKLLRQAVSKGPQSNGFLMWLTAQGNEEDYKKYEQGDLPESVLGEGPRQEAYRHFILWQCGQLAQEIRVLFDPDNLASQLFPRHRALSQLIAKMNALELDEAWEPGNEETIGWIYQYYNEPDLEIFRGNSSLKVPPHLVAPRTQQFTPRWVVKFLVHNTIGRLWMEMHPDSSIVEILDYLVPFDNETPEREVKPVSEITVLDPACGTMHFGLVAFDLFSFMY